MKVITLESKKPGMSGAFLTYLTCSFLAKNYYSETLLIQ
jgi:hypothetical protein